MEVLLYGKLSAVVSAGNSIMKVESSTTITVQNVAHITVSQSYCKGQAVDVLERELSFMCGSDAYALTS